jgi:hypothetical protein
MAPPAGADIEQPDCVAAGVGGRSSSHGARVHGWASGWGGRAATLRTIKRRSTRARSAPLSPAVAVVRTRPDGALACRPFRASRELNGDAPLLCEESRSVESGLATSTASSIERPKPRPHACGAICGPTTVTSGIGCSAHCGGSTPAASAAMRAQWRSKPAGVQTST